MINRGLVDLIAPYVDSGLITGMKVETESEGMPWDYISFLSGLAASSSIPLTVKIGGCEAITDLRMAEAIGIDEVVAPMIESVFSVHKFVEACKSVFPKHLTPKRKILLESLTAFERSTAILDFSGKDIEGVHVGRSDFTKSLNIEQNQNFAPDSETVVNHLYRIISQIKSKGFEVTLGGQVSEQWIDQLRNSWEGFGPNRIETRRFILDYDKVTSSNGSINQILSIELEMSKQRLALLNQMTVDASNYYSALRSRFSETELKNTFL